MLRTLFGKEVVLNPHAVPEKIIMHPDTWAAIEAKLLVTTSIKVPNEASHV